VIGDDRGITARNYGIGALSITTQAVTGTTDDGIDALNDGTSLTIITNGAVIGDDRGIYANNQGNGALMITTQAVTGTNENGIYAYNRGTDLTINAQGAVTGGDDGIEARNDSGTLSITTAMAVTGTAGDGINAYNSFGTSLTINAQGTVTGGDDGIEAGNRSGVLSITTTQTVIGMAGIGIDAFNDGTDLIIDAQGAVTGGTIGIDAVNDGNSILSITTTQAVTGMTDDGIRARNSTGGTALTINAQGAVMGGVDGIDADNENGGGILSITTNAAVTGGTGYGIRTNAGAGKTTLITLNDGAVVSSAAGLGIFNDRGDSTVTVNGGAAVEGTISLNDGSDNLIFAGGNFTGVTLFDGGDDTSVADGFIDTLTFAGSSGAVTSAVNWENVVIGNGSTISFSNNMLTTGMLMTNAGGTLDATGGGMGMLTINGNLVNNGFLTMRDGAAGDRTVINGDYEGTGELQVDVDFATNTADQLVVNGDVTGGTTTISVNDVSSGNATGANVLVVDVAGTTTAGAFVLDAPVISGAFIYNLGQEGSDSLLQGTAQDTTTTNQQVTTLTLGRAGFNPATPVYEVLPQVLSGLNALSSMQQRVSNRRWSGGATGELAQGYQSGLTNSLGEYNTSSGYGDNGAFAATQPAIWARIEGSASDIRSPVSTTSARFEGSRWQLQAGIDGELASSGNGQWVLGVNGILGRSSTDVFSTVGNGSISIESYGIGLTATWFGDDGLYVDGQARFSWFSADLSSATLGTLVNNDGSGTAFSLELGKRIDMGNGWVITPQAQIMTSSIDFDAFTGRNAELVSLSDGDTTTGRLGIYFETQGAQNQTFYALANIYSQFSGQSQVNVSGVAFTNRPDQWSGEIGLGGSINLDGATTLFGEATIATSLENFGDSNQFKGIAGVRVSF